MSQNGRLGLFLVAFSFYSCCVHARSNPRVRKHIRPDYLGLLGNHVFCRIRKSILGSSTTLSFAAELHKLLTMDSVIGT